LIRAERSAHNALLDLEELTDAEIERLRAHYVELARLAREALRQGRRDIGTPDVPLDWDSTAKASPDE
jgi:low affinity Fe/Cu permease